MMTERLSITELKERGSLTMTKEATLESSRHGPNWEHDCDTCRLIGTTIGGGRMHDLYICGKMGNQTLIARYGNKGHEYFSTKLGLAHPRGHAEIWAAQCIVQQSAHWCAAVCALVFGGAGWAIGHYLL